MRLVGHGNFSLQAFLQSTLHCNKNVFFGIEEEYLEVDRYKSIQAGIKIFKVQTI